MTTTMDDTQMINASPYCYMTLLMLFISDGGHCSREDAIACMELMMWKIRRG